MFGLIRYRLHTLICQIITRAFCTINLSCSLVNPWLHPVRGNFSIFRPQFHWLILWNCGFHEDQNTSDHTKKIIFPAIQEASRNWVMPIKNWKAALNRLTWSMPLGYARVDFSPLELPSPNIRWTGFIVNQPDPLILNTIVWFTIRIN